MSIQGKAVSCLMLISMILGTSAALGRDEPREEDSRQAYQELLIALRHRFALTPADELLPEVEIPSLDCDIKLDMQESGAHGVQLTVTRGSTWNVISAYNGAPMTYSSNSLGLTWQRYTHDCEEQGCDDYWYPSDTLFIGPRILEITSSSPYSHDDATLTCILGTSSSQ